MLNVLPKCRHRATHVAGVSGHIDDGVKLRAAERREAVWCVSVYTDKASACRNRSGNTPCGAGNLMARREGVSGNCSP